MVKWIGDWLIVNGVNAVTPHADTMKFHDPDAPPHFNRTSGNPQWRYYATWAGYFQRLQALSWASQPLLDVAVLYAAESRWMGPAQSEAPIVRALETRQISSAIFPYEVWATQGSFEDKQWVYNGQRFSAVVLPFVRFVPGAVMTRLREFGQAGGRVIVIDRWPEVSVDGREDNKVQEAVAGLRGSPSVALVPLQELPLVLHGAAPVTLTPPATSLMISRRKAPTGEWVFLHNRSLTETLHGSLRFRETRGKVARYEADQDRYFIISNSECANNLEVELEIPPYTLQCLRISNQIPALDAPLRFQTAERIKGPWQVSKATGDSGKDFELLGMRATLDDWRRWPGMASFAGSVRYRRTIRLPQLARGEALGIDAGAVGEIAELSVNGKPAGVRIAPPYVWDISALAQPGENEITIDVTNTAQAKWSDEFSRGDAVSGLLGPLRLLKARQK